MASPTQTIMFTAMARGIAIDTPTLPVSVLVSPRLTGATGLDAFPDWLRLDPDLKEDGNEGHLRGDAPFPYRRHRYQAFCGRNFGGRSSTKTPCRRIHVRRLRPAAGPSYPNRATLTLLKSIFQVGGLQLALPGEVNDERQGKRRMLLT